MLSCLDIESSANWSCIGKHCHRRWSEASDETTSQLSQRQDSSVGVPSVFLFFVKSFNEAMQVTMSTQKLRKGQFEPSRWFAIQGEDPWNHEFWWYPNVSLTLTAIFKKRFDCAMLRPGSSQITLFTPTTARNIENTNFIEDTMAAFEGGRLWRVFICFVSHKVLTSSFLRSQATSELWRNDMLLNCWYVVGRYYRYRYDRLAWVLLRVILVFVSLMLHCRSST